MSDTTQHTIGEKIEIIQATKEHGWNVAEASQATGIPRSTLLGYLATEDELFSTEGDPTSKRMSRPGIPLPHQASESVVVTLVKEKAFRGEKMSRSSIGAG
jgi:transposase-like protein